MLLLFFDYGKGIGEAVTALIAMVLILLALFLITGTSITALHLRATKNGKHSAGLKIASIILAVLCAIIGLLCIVTGYPPYYGIEFLILFAMGFAFLVPLTLVIIAEKYPKQDQPDNK